MPNTTTQLEQFRDIQNEFFDDNGKAFKCFSPELILERMLKLINQLETEINK